jgi:hypothetical protein
VFSILQKEKQTIAKKRKKKSETKILVIKKSYIKNLIEK